MNIYDVKKIMLSLKPIELIEILTSDICKDFYKRYLEEITEILGEYYINNWPKNEFGSKTIKLDILSLYLSEGFFVLYLKKEETKRIQEKFEEIKFLYTNITRESYNDLVGALYIEYTPDNFNNLYKNWIRDKKIDLFI